MLETHLDSPVTRRRLRTGPAADHIDSFSNWLHVHGYKPVTIDLLLRSLAGWTDWLLAGGFTSQDLLPGFEACQLAIREEQRVRYRRGPNQNSITAAAVFIRFLQHQGTLPLPVTPPSAGELWPLLGEFRAWMRQHRGLTETTLDVYDGVLVGLRETIGEDPRAYTAEALRRFVSDRARPPRELASASSTAALHYSCDTRLYIEKADKKPNNECCTREVDFGCKPANE